MRTLHSKKIISKITLIIVVLMLCNFAMPNIVYGETDTQYGGKLMEYLAKFLCFLPDSVTNILQHQFVSEENIDSNGEYKILYSPGIIFSGDVPALDTNFFETEKEEKERHRIINRKTYGAVRFDSESQNLKNAKNFYLMIEQNTDILKKYTEYGFEDNTTKKLSTSFSKTLASKINGIQLYDFQINIPWETEDNKQYTLVIRGNAPDTLITEDEKDYAYYKVVVDLKEGIVKKEYVSSALVLQPIIASWYKALTLFSLVGLLSVLVYLGIRIVLNSPSADDKAKYKSILKNWLFAVCLLFTLHYIMNFTVIVVEEIRDIFAVSIIEPDGADVLITTLRNRIANVDSWAEVIVEVVIYDVITIYTVIFTIQYIKRLVYLAFLTIIAPLITLTYPLDKIKDSKAQAFDQWLKDYVFFNLIQVVHIILYFIFVKSSFDMVESQNWVFALIAIGFLTQAEKIMKKMFGFNKSKSMGALTGAAVGAMIMNNMNKLKQIGKSGGNKEKTDNKEESKQIRTQNNNQLPNVNINNQGSTQNMPGYNNSSNTPVTSDAIGVNAQENQTAYAEEARNIRNSELFDRQESSADINNHLPNSLKNNNEKRNIKKGRQAVAKKYVGPAIINVLKTAGGAFMGLTGGTIGLAAGISQGDVGKALAGAAGGFAAGKQVGKRTIEGAEGLAKGISNIDKPIRNVIKTYKDGANKGDE